MLRVLAEGSLKTPIRFGQLLVILRHRFVLAKVIRPTKGRSSESIATYMIVIHVCVHHVDGFMIGPINSMWLCNQLFDQGDNARHRCNSMLIVPDVSPPVAMLTRQTDIIITIFQPQSFSQLRINLLGTELIQRVGCVQIARTMSFEDESRALFFILASLRWFCTTVGKPRSPHPT